MYQISDAGAADILKTLYDASFEGYLVGGCVRDLLLGATPVDFDICTNARPDEIKRLFHDRKTFDVGESHGTIGVLCGEKVYEITTYRSDGEYLDFRHPSTVTFVRDIEKDLKRRDFTINAMALSLSGELKDPFGGKNDLMNGIIRAVGDPSERFSEDPLRIMRALRFSSVLSFEIEKKTAYALLRLRGLLNNISKERISAELLKLLSGDNILSILLNYKEVFAEIIPELIPTFGFKQNTPYHAYDVWEHTARAVDACEKDGLLRLTLLLHDIAKPACHTVDKKGVSHFYGHSELGTKVAKEILTRLRFSNKDISRVVGLIKYHDSRFKPDIKTVRRCLIDFSPEFLKDMLAVERADASSHADKTRDESLGRILEFEKLLNEELSKGPLLKDVFALSGDDLKGIGFQGPAIKKALRKLMMAVSDGELSNEKNPLLDYAREIYKKSK